MKLLPITSLQAFAAGAALSSTSLGTTFTILSTSGLSESRLGVVLSSAAMLDDVVGLIMVQVISNLGRTDSGSSFNAVTVIRPVFVSLAFAVVVPIICKLTAVIAKKSMSMSNTDTKESTFRRLTMDRRTAFCIQTLVLIAFVVASTYAGTSNLFAAYLAGASISWWSSLDLELSRNSPSRSSHTKSERRTDAAEQASTSPTTSGSRTGSLDAASHALSGQAIYKEYYSAVVERILKPLFFASIGFSIPITQLFDGAIVWRGIVYTILMFIGKLVCGFWLVRFSGLPSLPVPALFNKGQTEKSASVQSPTSKNKKRKRQAAQIVDAAPQVDVTLATAAGKTQANTSKKLSRSKIPKPKSLYPPMMLGSAMVARGEIGFLIFPLAESTGIFSSGPNGSSELFLVVTWAVLLCTIIGPLSIGVMTKRVRRLQRREREGGARAGKEDPLGIWGVASSS
ncbi:hypothetical protein MBLNU457_4257t1 [Dothideomycetes sp. NU457]